MAISAAEERRLLAQLDQHDAEEAKNSSSAGLSDQEQKNLLWQLKKSDMDKMHRSIYAGLNEQSAKDVPGELSNIGRGSLAGVLKLGQGIGELQAKGLRALGVPIKPLQETAGSDVNTGISRLYSPQVASTPEGQIGYAAGQTLPLMGMPLGEGGVLAQTGKSALTSEALAPVFNPDQSLSDAYIQGLAPSAGAGAITALLHVPRGIGTALKMGGKATPEEFEANVRAAGDKPVSIGKLSKAPMVNKFESNFLSNLPFSGMSQKNIQVGEMLDKDVGDVLHELNVIPEEKPRYRLTGENNNALEPIPQETKIQKISSNIADNFKKNETISTKLYRERDRIAKENKTATNPSLLKSEAQNILEKDNITKSRKGYSRLSPEALKELKSAAKGEEIPFEEINFDKQAYNDLAEQARANGNRYEKKIFKRLASSLNTDAKNTLAQPGNEELAKAQSIADQHYKTKIAPILKNKSLRAHAEGVANKDNVIADFVKTGAYDQPEKVRAVLENLDPPYRKQLAHEFLTKGLKELEGSDIHQSDAVLSIYKKLGKDSKKLMFSPDQRQKLNRSLKTRKLVGLDINQMVNPKTGFVHAPLVVSGTAGAAAAGLGHGLSALGIPAPLAYPLAVGGIGGAGNIATRYLTSPLSRNVYRKGLQMSAKPVPKMSAHPATLTNMLYQLITGGQQ
jgi:hypothetical protein